MGDLSMYYFLFTELAYHAGMAGSRAGGYSDHNDSAGTVQKTCQLSARYVPT